MTPESIVEAMAKLAPDARAVYLLGICGNDSGLRAEVEARWAALESASRGNTVPYTPDGPGATSAYVLKDDHPTITIGRYTLLQRLGVGGMGEVWAAEQKEPIKRKVALKLIKTGTDSVAVLQRFELERQALAMMDHPNIARVYDGGMTESWSAYPALAQIPYFVMELVHGQTLNTFCDNAKLTVAERLQLFIPICQAVQHAHQKGVIHRDLKPANILVTVVDGKPVPKIIDFGVAKAISGKLMDDAISTQFGAVIGTLEYMSPEQAGNTTQDIDTRSDIYSLGVILYELLTGLRPFDRERFKLAALNEMIRIIREEEPSKPSTRLSTADSLPSLAASRQMEPRRLTNLLRGELDWVVMKCLEKQRDRRYESANGLARDIERFLANEPVEAKPPSASYRFSKFIARHRGATAAVAVIVLSLLAGMVGTTLQMFRAQAAEVNAKNERDAKEEARQREAARAEAEIKQRKRAEKAENDAKEQLAKANEITDFLRFDLINQAGSKAQANRQFEGNPNLTVKEALDRAAATIGTKFANRPELEAHIRYTLCDTYLDLGEAEKAIAQITRAIELYQVKYGAEAEETLSSQATLASAYQLAERHRESEALFKQLIETRTKLQGPEHPFTLRAKSGLYASYRATGQIKEGVAGLEKVYEAQQRVLGKEETDTIRTALSLALMYQADGKIKQAIPLYELVRDVRLRTLGPLHPEKLGAQTNLAFGYRETGKTSEMINIYLQILESQKKILGPDHSQIESTLQNLGATYLASGKHPEAIKVLTELREKQLKRYGPESARLLGTTNNLANVLKSDGKVKEATRLFEEVLAGNRKLHGPDHQQTLIALNNLATVYGDAERYEESMKLLVQARDTLIRTSGPEHPITLSTIHNLAAAYLQLGKPKEAIEQYEKLVETRKRVLGPDHPDTLSTMFMLARSYRSSGKVKETITILEGVREAQTRKLGADHPDTLSTIGGLAVMYRADGRIKDALNILAALVPTARKKMGLTYPSTITFTRNWIINLELDNQWAKAVEVGFEQLAVDRKLYKPQDQRLADSLVNVSNGLLELKRFQEAEPLIREALVVCQKNEPDNWHTFYAQALLGSALRGQKKYAEAEPLLREGYAGMKARQGKMPAHRLPQLRLRLQQLILWAEENNKPVEAASWKKELETLPK